MSAVRWMRHRFPVLCALLVLAGCAPKETVYVTASVLNLRSGPSTKARVVGRLMRGQELTVRERAGDWLAVSSEEDAQGWVHGDYVGDAAAIREADGRERTTRSGVRRVRRPATGSAEGKGQTSADVTKLGRSVDQMLAGFPEDTAIESLEPVNGEDRARAVLADGQVAEFWGDGENVSRAAMMVPVVGASDEAVSRNADIVLTFVRNAVPRWERDPAWLAERLRVLTSRDVGKMGFDADGKSVRFNYIKPLGAVRVLIYPEA